MNKLKSKSGMTLTELISGIIVLLLVAGILTVGVRLGAKAYVESVSASEAQVLCATLTELVTDELRYAGSTEGTGDANDPVKIFSQKFGGDELEFKTDEEGDREGQIYLYKAANGTDAEKKSYILSSRSYPYNLHAYVRDLTYNSTSQIFSLTIEVQGSSGNTLATTSFEVRKVNP
jgi:type II secretory pathway pseudopilin PulG